MKKTIIITISLLMLTFMSAGVQAEQPKDLQMDMHIMMKLLNHALCHSLEGANLQMLGYMGMANDQLDKDTIKHGSTMLREGRQGIMDVLEGEPMKQIYKEGKYNKESMDDMHKLGELMLKVIDQAEKMHKGIK
ncbi:MAG: hypothetical protein AB1499_09315 [Nitrospirota bacterium]